ncbi:MAG: RNB domain-containing ribonuclease [Collinsella sp.]
MEAARANGVDLRAFLRNADALARARREIRRKRGSIDFDTPEVHVLLDGAGMPVDIVTRERTAATSLVEEAMLLANRMRGRVPGRSRSGFRLSRSRGALSRQLGLGGQNAHGARGRGGQARCGHHARRPSRY